MRRRRGKGILVSRAGHDRNVGRLVEGILDAVAAENVNANFVGEVLQWLNGNRGEDIDEIDGSIDRGLREIREFREQRIESHRRRIVSSSLKLGRQARA